MKKPSVWSLGLLTAIAISVPARAQEVTTETDANGVTYRVTRQRVQQSVPTTEYQSQQQKVYHPQPTVQYQSYTQNYVTPVTQYEWQTRLNGWWNPFDRPYYSYEMRPVTRWVTTPGTVQVPVTRTDWVEETRTVQVPVTTYRTVQYENSSRVAISVAPTGTAVASSPAPAPASVATRPTDTRYYGGSTLPKDPPGPSSYR